MPDFIRAGRECVELRREMIVRVREDEDAHAGGSITTRAAGSRTARGVRAEHAGDHFGRGFGGKQSKDKTKHGTAESILGSAPRVTERGGRMSLSRC